MVHCTVSCVVSSSWYTTKVVLKNPFSRSLGKYISNLVPLSWKLLHNTMMKFDNSYFFLQFFFIESKLRLLPSLNRLWFGLSPTENLLLKIVGALLNSIKTKVLPPFSSKISSDLMLEIIKSWWRIPLDWTKWKWGWTFYLRLPFQKVKFCFVFLKSIPICVVLILENISIL